MAYRRSGGARRSYASRSRTGVRSTRRRRSSSRTRRSSAGRDLRIVIETAPASAISRGLVPGVPKKPSGKARL